MGSCATVDETSSPFSTMKTASFGTQTMIPESPKKENPVTNAANGGFPMKPRRSFASNNKSFGSKDETFYDSQLWLESDCEDDFYSVGGDFTPSRGNTPRHSIGGRTPRATNFMSEEKFPNSVFIRTPTRRRKKLFELFRDSIREEELEDTEEHQETSGKFNETTKTVESKVTAHSKSDLSRNGNHDTEKGKPYGSGRGCFPGLFSCGGFLEKKRKMRSAAMAVKK